MKKLSHIEAFGIAATIALTGTYASYKKHLERDALTSINGDFTITVSSPNIVTVENQTTEFQFNYADNMLLVTENEGYSKTWLPTKSVFEPWEINDFKTSGCDISFKFNQRHSAPPLLGFSDYLNDLNEQKIYIADAFYQNNCLDPKLGI
jgi:hypothetical protein